jgi:hypothetical protein
MLFPLPPVGHKVFVLLTRCSSEKLPPLWGSGSYIYRLEFYRFLVLQVVKLISEETVTATFYAVQLSVITIRTV